MLPDVLREVIAVLVQQLKAHERRYQCVQTILEQLLRWRFGRKSERTDERQLYLFVLQWEDEGRTAKQLADELGLDPNDPMAPDEEEADRKCPRCAETIPKIDEW